MYYPSPHSPPTLAAAITGFAQYARSKGLNVGIEETLSAMRAFDLGVFQDKAVFYYSLRALFCSRPEDLPVFDRAFKVYWETKPDDDRPLFAVQIRDEKNLPKQQSVLTLWGKENKKQQEEQDSKTVAGANAAMRLRRTDFSKVNEMDDTLLEELAARLWREMLKRLKRRRLQNARQGRVDLRRTIRASLGQGGEPLRLAFRGRRPKKLRLVVLLDVSGSMDKYSFFLLRFVWALQSYFEEVESFVFSTNLRRITAQLKTGGLEKMLQQLSLHTDNWSGGTRIGECFRAFNDDYAKRLLSRSSCVIVLSDGLDTGEAGLLDREIRKIARRTKRLIWLNPLKGMSGYAPEARGMREALPYVDAFRPAHNLESLLELENLLVNV